MSKKNIFIVGIDDFNLNELKAIDTADQYNFHSLGDYHDIQQKGKQSDVRSILEKARSILNDFDGSIDGIIGYYDFPITLISFLLTDEYDLPGPSFISGLQCEHKYWSRVEQKKVIPEQVPDFVAVNPREDRQLDKINLDTPFWLKPVKAYSSSLGFKIENQDDLDEALKQINEKIHVYGDPFNFLLEKADLPSEIAKVDGNYCIAEKMIAGHQCTVSGYVFDDKVNNYGVVDSINYENHSSFFYYLFPSDLPEKVQERLKEITEKIMGHLKFNCSTFNVEYFYDQESDKIHLLEINPRMSQSHSDLYAKVSGNSNHKLLVELASDEQPSFDANAGKYAYAGKFHYCVFDDGEVEKAPDEELISKIKNQYPDLVIFPEAKEGDKLSESHVHDSYSYRLATMFIGADSREKLMEKYDDIINQLGYKVKHFK